MDITVTSAFDMLQTKLDERYNEACKQIAGARSLFNALGSPDGAVAPDAAKSTPAAAATTAVVKKAPAKKPAAAPKKKPNANKPSANKPSAGSPVRQAVLDKIKDWATADKIKTDTGLTDPQIRAILNAVDLKAKIEKKESDAGVMYKLKA